MKPTYRKSWAGNLLMCTDLTIGPLHQGQQSVSKLKSAYIPRLLLLLEVGDVRPTYNSLNFGRHLEFWQKWKMSSISKTLTHIEQFWVNVGPTG